ncbi:MULTISPECIES: DUF2069 domain-containing protein [unclassified Cupriavidus]|uniref:DUF2069 domain-containing protein n=1 Tax=unclassified Cupriavidus TaxID=2640874 RepID=UPI001C006099|nr:MULTISPECIES: DUF2069 domain-containing protein [unclassified Cupriavidus]MCA3183977.1 DUF2069 domain-containing protein [Cupriavidus sp.]MCA3189540.1 DUF2069 domain-containing protein [Cupriavidus sp.]MCA3195620.1 DUF2069 domain-containing protein [Cupriavidus sp.]MCA3201175.1 DUF2069 domain-containing protein [Cupriavidus sp.]MCA3207437.1 DUF2069 domain-containing protein [Cupriavidus sp.]
MKTPDDLSLHSQALWRLSLSSLVALIALCIGWEWFLAPLRPGGSWLVLKFVLLLPVLRGVWTRNRYTMQWSSMLILLYFTEGIVRATSDRAPSSWLAWGEVALTVLFFTATILYLRPYKRRAKAIAQSVDKTSQPS